MKRTREPNRRRTASTTSTTGPQVRLVQKRGVAKVTTNGLWALTDPAIEYRSSARSGGTRVVSSETAWVLARVGVADGGALAPTATESERGLTSSSPSAWIFAPPGSATSQ